jgi:hypothetical protein
MATTEKEKAQLLSYYAAKADQAAEALSTIAAAAQDKDKVVVARLLKVADEAKAKPTEKPTEAQQQSASAMPMLPANVFERKDCYNEPMVIDIKKLPPNPAVAAANLWLLHQRAVITLLKTEAEPRFRQPGYSLLKTEAEPRFRQPGYSELFQQTFLRLITQRAENIGAVAVERVCVLVDNADQKLRVLSLICKLLRKQEKEWMIVGGVVEKDCNNALDLHGFRKVAVRFFSFQDFFRTRYGRSDFDEPSRDCIITLCLSRFEHGILNGLVDSLRDSKIFHFDCVDDTT